MRKHLLGMASGAAIAVATMATGAVPAGAIQIAPGASPAAETNITLAQFQDRGFRGNVGAQSGGRNFGSGATMRSSRGSSANFTARSFQGTNRATVQRFDTRRTVQTNRSFQTTRTARARDFDRRTFARIDGRSSGDWQWRDRYPRRVHSHFHGRRFLGAVIIGVPFGYAAVSGNPCYDWIYGPQGWGYYWNYDRCPV